MSDLVSELLDLILIYFLSKRYIYFNSWCIYFNVKCVKFMTSWFFFLHLWFMNFTGNIYVSIKGNMEHSLYSTTGKVLQTYMKVFPFFFDKCLQLLRWKYKFQFKEILSISWQKEGVCVYMSLKSKLNYVTNLG